MLQVIANVHVGEVFTDPSPRGSQLAKGTGRPTRKRGGAKCLLEFRPSLNDLSAKWISESGLYELATSCKLPALG